MSKIANRIGHRYDDILAYFRRCPFGSIPSDMTVLSVLPPVDRCLILERVFDHGDGDEVALVDKLSMAYMKSGWLDLGRLFLRACCQSGIIDEFTSFELIRKIEGLSNLRISAVTYEDALCTLPKYEAFDEVFCRLIRTLCEDYIDRNVFQDVDFFSPVWASDIKAFISERQGFIGRIGGVV